MELTDFLFETSVMTHIIWTLFNCEGFLLAESIHIAFSVILVYSQKHLKYKISEISLEEESFDLT